MDRIEVNSSASMMGEPGSAQTHHGIGITKFLAVLWVSMACCVVQLALFSVLRKVKPLQAIYAPFSDGNGSKSPRVPPQSLVSLVARLLYCDDEYIRGACGTDCYFLLRYLKAFACFFLCSALVILPILLPLNYNNGIGQSLNEDRGVHNRTTVVGLDTLAWGNVRPGNLSRYTAHLVMSIGFITATLVLIFHELKRYARISHASYQEQWSLSEGATAIVVLDIPDVFLNAEALSSIYERLSGGVVGIIIPRDYTLLEGHIKERNELQGKPERDLTDHARLRWVEMKIGHGITRDSVNKSLYPLCGCAVVVFRSPSAALVACCTAPSYAPFTMTTRPLFSGRQELIMRNIKHGARQRIARKVLAVTAVLCITLLWTIPVACTGAIGQVNSVFRTPPGLVKDTLDVVAGVTPPVILGFLLSWIPQAMQGLANFSGVVTKSERTRFVQNAYFFFLFVQVFLVVSISSFFAASIREIVSKLFSVDGIFYVLADNLPKAANYFFSYMLLHALSSGSSTLLQITELVKWIRTKEQSVKRSLPVGQLLPVYTNFACITIVYSIVSPLILLFSALTFSLLLLSYRYLLLFVISQPHGSRSSGAYPRAIDQTFTGVYVMEACVAGLFFIVLDERGRHRCLPHGAIMVFLLALTAVYHVFVHKAFSGLMCPTQGVQCTKAQGPEPAHSTAAEWKLEMEYFPEVIQIELKKRASLDRPVPCFI